MLSKLDFVLSKKDMELAYDGLGPLSLQESGFDTIHGVSNTGEACEDLLQLLLFIVLPRQLILDSLVSRVQLRHTISSTPFVSFKLRP